MKYTFDTEAHGKIAVDAKDWTEAFDRAGLVYRALDLVDAGSMKIYRLPKTFFDDYCSRFEIIPVVIRESKHHYFVPLSASSYKDLLGDADYYHTCKDQFDSASYGLCDSAKWTQRALINQGPVAK
jgi:hypothetical protein